ncbi:unnamed protein product [Blepharisma stoltei]|uniref:Citrate synthase n=1 Tax=Blepharisma stoltei TaxID=1481888 RepID=A0AAU9J4L7_9CILI|nr:unnamed protein product [Blepharisma stoltei]
MEGAIIEGEATITLPDGTSAKLPFIRGTQGPPVIDIRSLFTQLGCLTLDPGYTSTSSCLSAITYTDGEKGELWYRGYAIEDLANNCTFLEVCYLLLYGELPNTAELERFENAVKNEMLIHMKLIDFYSSFQQGAHPMAIMVGVVGALSAFMHEDIDVLVAEQREAAAIRVLAKFPMMAAIAYRTAYGLPIVFPKKKFGYTENFLYMMFSDPMSDDFTVDPVVANALEKIFILHADHEQNASTSTVRIAGSSLANPYACVAAGIASLWGPMHGGANEAVLAMLDEVKSVENVDTYIAKAKNPNDSFRLMGFGHRVYKNHDPRNHIIQEIAHEVLTHLKCNKQDIFDLAIELEKKALSDDYFIKRKLFPNVDFYSGIVLEAIGIPRDMFTVIFALARVIGWMSQWHEMMSESVKKIGRPRQLYIGAQKRTVQPIELREGRESIHPEIINSPRKVWSPIKDKAAI